MGGDPNVPNPVGTNVATGATMYSTLAGILAGFAFTAIVLLVVTWLADSPRAHRVLAVAGRALVASFFGLLIMCVLYAAESTSAYSWGLTISGNVILLDGFVGVGILVIYAIILMLEAASESGGEPTGEQPSLPGRNLALFARAFACVLNLLLLGMAYQAAGDYEAIRGYGLAAPPVSRIDVLAWVVLGLQLAVTARAGWVIVRHDKRGRFFGTHEDRDHARSPRFPIYLGLTLTVGSAAGYVAVNNTLAETDTISPVLVVALLILAFATTCGTTVHLASTRPRRIKSEPSAAQAAPTPQLAGDGGGTSPPTAARLQPPQNPPGYKRRARRVIAGRGAVKQRTVREQARVLAQVHKGENAPDTPVGEEDAQVPVRGLLAALSGFEPEQVSMLMARLHLATPGPSSALNPAECQTIPPQVGSPGANTGGHPGDDSGQDPAG